MSFNSQTQTNQGRFLGPRKEVGPQTQKVEQVLKANGPEGYQKQVLAQKVSFKIHKREFIHRLPRNKKQKLTSLNKAKSQNGMSTRKLCPLVLGAAENWPSAQHCGWWKNRPPETKFPKLCDCVGVSQNFQTITEGSYIKKTHKTIKSIQEWTPQGRMWTKWHRCLPQCWLIRLYRKPSAEDELMLNMSNCMKKGNILRYVSTWNSWECSIP